jgi:uncharacterized protein (TIGR03000 family)
MFCYLSLLFLALPVFEADAKFYVTYYSYQSNPHKIRYTHTFAHFVKTTPLGAEEQTISWMPASLRIAVLRRQPEPGVNLSLGETFQLAQSIGARVTNQGTFEITRDLYERAANQVKYLRSGQVQYKCVDSRFRGAASNCIHAVSDLGGYLDTGTQSGDAATAAVVRHLDAYVVRQPARAEPAELSLVSLVPDRNVRDESDSRLAQSNTATIRVSVPTEASVWIEGDETRQKGTERLYETPPVTPGKEYFYDITARWRDNEGKEVTRKERVTVRANQTASVSFLSTLLASKAPQPK